MDNVSIFLLVIAAIFLIGILGELIFSRYGIPDVIWLILVGVCVGPVFGLVSRAELQVIAPYFGALTLVVVLFDGGSELRFAELSRAAGRGTMLSVIGFVFAVFAVAAAAKIGTLVGILPYHWGWTQCILLGTILGGSSSVVIMPALSKAGLSSRITNLVNLESALTDVLSVVATGAVIGLSKGSGQGPVEAGAAFGRSFGLGIIMGTLFGLLVVLILRRLRKSAYAYPLILGSLLILYVVIDEAGGSAALGILAAAIMIGNAPALSRLIGLAKTARLGRNLEGVHDEMTFIVKSFFFTFIGAMLGPPWGLLFFGVALGFILWIARIPNVALTMAGSGVSSEAKQLISVLMPRGMAAGVLAMFPYQAGIPYTRNLPVVVFAAVFTTIILFAIGFPLLKRRVQPEDLQTIAPEAPSPPADSSLTDLGTIDTVDTTESLPPTATPTSSASTTAIGMPAPSPSTPPTTVDSTKQPADQSYDDLPLFSSIPPEPSSEPPEY